MQVLSGAYFAVFGRAAGGSINVIIRSGANDLHGSGMALYRPLETSACSPALVTNLLAAAPTFQTPPNITDFASDYQVMYGHNASLQVQRQLAKDIAVNVQYSYWGHRFAPCTRDINRSAPAGYTINPMAGTDLNNDLVLNDRFPFRARNSFTVPGFFQTDFRLTRRFKTNHLNANCSISGCTGAVVNPDGRNFQSGTRYSL